MTELTRADQGRGERLWQTARAGCRFGMDGASNLGARRDLS
jgi:hypothetical protein